MNQNAFDSIDYDLLEDLAVYYMQEIGRKYADCGYGGNFIKWIFSADPKPYNSYGNGAAMRVNPAGLSLQDRN
ncbi:hypothetical protein [Alkalibacterium sp. 20]|uniref:hypothetical protein n=1 Tax=Alkalibacterium sp. 20 TaxID=1798803 RepID=UPI000A9EDA46